MNPMGIVRSAALIVLVLSGCATPEPYRLVNDSASPVIGPGFSVLPPSGGKWVVSESSRMNVVSFGKVEQEHFRQGGSVITVAALVKATKHDIGSPEGLRSEVDDYVRRNLASYKIVRVNVEPYRDAQRNTDCAKINTVSEESGNPLHPGKVLLMTVAGKACRHPLSASHYVQVTYSERRPVGVPPLIDAVLREQCETTVDSLEFLPIPRS